MLQMHFSKQKFTFFSLCVHSSFFAGEVFDFLVAHGRMKEKEARAKFREVKFVISAVAPLNKAVGNCMCHAQDKNVGPEDHSAMCIIGSLLWSFHKHWWIPLGFYWSRSEERSETKSCVSL